MADEILNEANYEIRKVRDRRHAPKQIIISQVRNFYEFHTPIKPILRIGSSKFTWNSWQRYFYKVLMRFRIPFHYFIEQIADDFVVNVAEPEYAPSYFMQELSKLGIVSSMLDNAIVVAVGEDFSLETVSDRMYQQLCFRCIVPLQVRNSKYVDAYNIQYIDDVIDWGRYNEAVKNKQIKFDITPSKYFDENTFRMFYRHFRSSIRTT